MFTCKITQLQRKQELAYWVRTSGHEIRLSVFGIDVANVSGKDLLGR